MFLNGFPSLDGSRSFGSRANYNLRVSRKPTSPATICSRLLHTRQYLSALSNLFLFFNPEQLLVMSPFHTQKCLNLEEKEYDQKWIGNDLCLEYTRNLYSPF